MPNKDFFTALDALETERRLDKELLIASLESGLASAYKKEYGEPRAVKVNLNPEKFLIKFMAYQTVVEGEPENETQISLEDAKKKKKKRWAILSVKMSRPKLSRIASQTAKQVIMQRINDG